MFNVGLRDASKNLLAMIGTTAKGGNYKMTEWLEQEIENRPARDLVATEEAMADAVEAMDETNKRLAKCKMTREEFLSKLAAYQAAKQAATKP